MQFIWGLCGILVLGGIAWLISIDRKSINLRTVISALILQIAFGFIVLKWEFGRTLFGYVINFIEA